MATSTTVKIEKIATTQQVVAVLKPVRMRAMLYDGSNISFDKVKEWMYQSGLTFEWAKAPVGTVTYFTWKDDIRKRELWPQHWLVQDQNGVFRSYNKVGFDALFTPEPV